MEKNPLFYVNDRDICFHGRLKIDVEAAIEKLKLLMKEVEEENEVSARIQLPQIFNDDYSRYYYGTSHNLEVNQKGIRISSSPRILNGGDEADQFTKSRTVFMIVLDAELEYLEPPKWVYARQCDCHGSGVVGSWQYKKMRIINILTDNCRNDSCYVYNHFDSCCGGFLPFPPEMEEMVHVDPDTGTWSCSLHYDQVVDV